MLSRSIDIVDGIDECENGCMKWNVLRIIKKSTRNDKFTVNCLSLWVFLGDIFVFYLCISVILLENSLVLVFRFFIGYFVKISNVKNVWDVLRSSVELFRITCHCFLLDVVENYKLEEGM